MARSRNIKPGFFSNEYLADLPPLARILFVGLWCLADKEGRLEDRPKKIKAEILPYDNCDVNKLLNNLASAGERFVVRYEVEGKKYIQITNFSKHQNPHKNETPSVIPEYSRNGASDSSNYASSTVLVPDCNGSNPADSLNLIPDSLNLIPDSLFDVFWKAYPKKKSKEDARKAWKKLKVDNALLTRILEAVEQAKKSADWLKDNGQFIPHPATWLNGKRWEDEQPERQAKPEKYENFYL